MVLTEKKLSGVALLTSETLAYEELRGEQLELDMASKDCTRLNGGHHCCLPGCTSSDIATGRIYRVPSKLRKRFGASTKRWAEKFEQILFQYRCDAKFKERIRNGQAYICFKHFKDSDFHRSNVRTTLKFGALPTKNLPKKSHHVKASRKRKSIDNRSTVSKKRKPSIKSVADIMVSWKASEVRGWRIYQISRSAVHFTYYKIDLLHATPSISLLISEKDALEFSVAFGGVYAPKFSATLEFGTKTLENVLHYLLNSNVCSGYASVPNSISWAERNIPRIQEGDIIYNKRFFSEDCEVAYSGKSCDTKICIACMRYYSKCTGIFKRKIKQEDETDWDSVVNTPLSRCTDGRVQSTVTSHHGKIEQLQKEMEGCGVSISQSLKELVEAVANSDNFLREWWFHQKQLHEAGSNHERRYPPSVIRYCLMLHAKSPSVYHLAQEITILPSDRALRREDMKSLSAYKKGIPRGVANRAPASENCHDFAEFCADEMTMKEDLVFHSITGEVIGFVDYDVHP